MKKLLFLLVLQTFIPDYINSQVYVNPQSGMKSHPTLDITKVEAGTGSTVIYFTVENKIDGGTFCIDKNTFIVYPDGSRIRIMDLRGIPACPEIHKFLAVGEKLSFSLGFPPLKTGTRWIDIIEECDQNCVWFYGIILDSELNARLESAFTAADQGKPEENIKLFRTILDDIDDENIGIEGLLYINIINAAIESGNQVEASVWYKRLARSSAPRVQYYLKYLNDKGIKY
jgi:hypothetical protein